MKIVFTQEIWFPAYYRFTCRPRKLSGCASDYWSADCGSTPPGRQQSSMEIDHEIFSMVIISHLRIQDGQVSVSGERMCTILVNRLED